jgi:hypothetical protein
MEFMERTSWFSMEPRDDLVSRGYCLAKPGEYVVYLPDGGEVEVSLADSEGTLSSTWLNPRTGNYHDSPTVEGGRRAAFISPFDGDAVLHIAGAVKTASHEPVP